MDEFWKTIISGLSLAASIETLKFLLDLYKARRERAAQTREAHIRAAQEVERARVEAEAKRDEAVLDEATAIRQELRRAEQDLRQQLMQALQTIAEQGAKISYLEAQNNNFAQRMAALSLERDTYHEELKRERIAREKLQQEYYTERARFQEELHAANQRIAELERTVAELRSQNAQFATNP